ncbi:MAG TPA: hypothetical protein VFQ61_37420 [Polyangiaceae bacterium]|nr:hypothetical protein [Polyangiaceae bacterium]
MSGELANIARVLVAAGLLVCACRTAKPAPCANETKTARREDAPSLAARIHALSAQSRVLATEPGSVGDRVSALLSVPSESCAVMIARAGPSIEDLDLFAYGEDGSVLGSDEGPDTVPGLLVCPPHPTRIWIAARIAAGYGLVALGAQIVEPKLATQVAAALGVRSDGPKRTGVPVDLETALAEHRQEIGGEWQDQRRSSVPLDARLPTRVSATIDAERCLDAVLVPSNEVGHLELNALDESGAILGRARAMGRNRALVVCASEPAQVTFELRPLSGRGPGWLTLSQSKPGSESSIDSEIARVEVYPSGSLEEEQTRLRQQLAREHGYANAQRVLSGQAEVGRLSSSALHLKAGCTRLDLIGARPLRGLQAFLLNDALEIEAQQAASSQLTFFTCSAHPRSARLDLEARLRAGPFALWASGEPDVPANLMNAPLAANRLLESMVSRGVLRRASEIGQVRTFDMSDSRIENLDLTVPFGRCMDVTLALGAGASGAEIRLVGSDGAQVALGRGSQVGTARVCALSADSAENRLKTRAELRVIAGSTQALVATRMLSPSR